MSLQEDLLILGNREASLLSNAEIQAKIDRHITQMFSRVGGMLLLAFGTAFAVSTGWIPLGFTSTGYWIALLAGFGIILWTSRKRQTLSMQTLRFALIAFALLQGYALTGVFLAYGLGSVQSVFLLTSVMFIGLSFAGRYFDVDVSKVGTVLMGGLIALIVAMVLNMFRGNEQFSIWISVIGIILFSALIIYDMNVLKQQALVNDDRIPLLMAMGMFLNFINIFLFLLRLIGGRE